MVGIDKRNILKKSVKISKLKNFVFFTKAAFKENKFYRHPTHFIRMSHSSTTNLFRTLINRWTMILHPFDPTMDRFNYPCYHHAAEFHTTVSG